MLPVACEELGKQTFERPQTWLVRDPLSILR